MQDVVAIDFSCSIELRMLLMVANSVIIRGAVLEFQSATPYYGSAKRGADRG